MPQYNMKKKAPEAPTFENFLKLLSSDQRRRIVTILYKNGQFKPLRKILDQEGPKTLEYFTIWREYEDRKAQKGEGTFMDTSPPPPVCLSDSEDDDDPDNPDNDPTKWTPRIRDDFFEKFPEEMNILILGETGVGKSTFINALANYLQFGNIYQARDNFQILIRTSFTYSDSEFNQQRIECDPTISQEPNEVDNEKIEIGQSSTQAPKSYLISCGPPERMKKIRIIDTPGIGDSRGIEQEKENFKKILDFIAQYKELHAICILMKSNETRLALNFRYCLNELFTHLHISAAKNILFCFTNARQTLYQPGDVYPTLRSYLGKLQSQSRTEIPLNQSTMYCFDNESFRFLCAWREGAQFSPEEQANFSSSWKITVKQTFRLLKRISQLPVHKVADTIAVNNIRATVLTMAKPTAEFSKNQILNIQLMDRKIKEIEDCLKLGEDLEGKLYTEQVELIPEELSHPITVCAAQKCVEYKKLSNNPNAKMEVVYKTVCHSPCSVEGVQTESRPNPGLKECYVFQTRDNHCKVCGCSWEEHIHRRYKLDKVVKRILDPAVESMLKNCTSEKEAAELFLENEKERRKNLEHASKFAMSHSAEFAGYLKENCLLPYNDAYTEYIDQLIKDAKITAAEGGSTDQLKALESSKDVYDTHVQVIESQRNRNNPKKTAQQINTMAEKFKKSKDCEAVLQEVQKIELISLEKPQTNKDIVIQTRGGWFDKFSSAWTTVTTTAANLASGVTTTAANFASGVAGAVGFVFSRNKKK